MVMELLTSLCCFYFRERVTKNEGFECPWENLFQIIYASPPARSDTKKKLLLKSFQSLLAHEEV